MRFRRFVFFTCIFVLSVLFIDGISVLAVITRKTEPKQEVRQGTSTGKIKIQDESSIMSSEPVNLLVLGLDEEGVRSDVIMLVNYNPDIGRINLLSIARDTRVRAKGKVSKINALVGLGGENLVISKVEELTDLDIDYYLTLDFAGFRKIVDALGGVEFDVPMDMNYDDPEQGLHIHLKQGRQILNGDKAEQYVRYRKGNRRKEGYQDGDIDRMKAQQKLMRALLEQKLKLKYFLKLDDIYFILKEHMRTNIEIGDIKNYLPKLRNIEYSETKTFTIPGDSVYTNGIWYYIYDEKKLENIIEVNFYK
jgi:LCP family protein required for cell wall assembly